MVKPLYQDRRIKVDYLLTSGIDHELLIDEGEGGNLLLQRGVLDELARTNRDKLQQKIANFAPTFSQVLEGTELTFDAIHVAICQAYIEQEKREQQMLRG